MKHINRQLSPNEDFPRSFYKGALHNRGKYSTKSKGGFGFDKGGFGSKKKGDLQQNHLMEILL